ncbi:chemotaxis protein CheB [Fulvimonas soli]|uniref:protein-glutamate methylesterase n=1 Tax=Fulvimonas soli TaxID=155197 RepID=A0A316HU69_9GAMM|nr:chemotaxis protein CheB [Fulvimonas soli]PWK84743.1 two-component system chemotaxis response regulator CheB/chemosensory pili system protein ChpB (putative protein-glutamate methylesterase) [Fulvimonas soli]TNY27326.1 hypothetical protein BV497_03960 [Fulvimonas soli]
MAERATAVALLFDDGALGAQLREALAEHGARIVHEGPLDGLDRALLQGVGADVVVVNLDDGDDDALDRLYDAIDGDHPRVVFNDAQASRALEGWDRARWARHLAMKVLASGDADPPRPEDARPLEPPAPAPQAAAPAAPTAEPPAEPPAPAPLPVLDEVPHDPHAAESSEDLAAELEALLASEDPVSFAAEGDAAAVPAEADAIRADTMGDIDALLAGDALADGGFVDDADQARSGSPVLLDDAALSEAIAAPVDEVDELEALLSAAVPAGDTHAFSGGPDPDLAEHERAESAAAPQAPAAAPAAPVAPRLSDSWSLVDDADLLPPERREKAAAFGIEKVDAADFLAPDSGSEAESPITPGLTLELVSIEEAIAPQEYQPNEMVLDDLQAAISRVVLLGATTESTHSVCEFLSALPAGLRATVLHTQHTAGKPADALVEHLAGHCALPVRLAGPGMRARSGEVLVVPTGQQVRLLRDGRVELLPGDAQALHSPSIDVSFTLAANVFGRDAVAILFAGQSTDAVGGCQAVHDRGGQVWVEASHEHFADMVGAVMAEHLSHYAGTPRELAAKLVELIPTD